MLHFVLAAHAVPVVAAEKALPGEPSGAFHAVEGVEDMVQAAGRLAVHPAGEVGADPVERLAHGANLVVKPAIKRAPVGLQDRLTGLQIHAADKKVA